MDPKLEATGTAEEVAEEIAKNCIRMPSYTPKEGITAQFGEYQRYCSYKGWKPDYRGFQLWLDGAR